MALRFCILKAAGIVNARAHNPLSTVMIIAVTIVPYKGPGQIIYICMWWKYGTIFFCIHALISILKIFCIHALISKLKISLENLEHHAPRAEHCRHDGAERDADSDKSNL